MRRFSFRAFSYDAYFHSAHSPRALKEKRRRGKKMTLKKIPMGPKMQIFEKNPLKHSQMTLKGQCHEIFCFWFFSSISFPPAPEYPIRTVSNFFENSRRYSQLNIDHRCRWHRWQMKKIFNQKIFYNFVGTLLDSRVNINIHFSLQVHFKVSAAWY